MSKNDKILRIVEILKRNYLNKNNIATLDLNPRHFIDEYQFVFYVGNIIMPIDGHYYYPRIISFVNEIKWVLNPLGYLCIDYPKIRRGIKMEFVDWPNWNKKIVLDMRGCSIHTAASNFLVSFLCTFSCIRDKLTDGQIIYTYKNKNNEDKWMLKYENNKLIHLVYDEEKTILNMNKYKRIECNEIVCIGLQNTISTRIVNKLGIKVYLERDGNVDPYVYGSWQVGTTSFSVPGFKIDLDEEYKYSIGIPDEYYPNS